VFVKAGARRSAALLVTAQRAELHRQANPGACQDPAVLSSELAVGERARRRAGLAIVTSLALVASFAAFTWLSKETPSLYVRQPWQDDPYDVLVSLDFVVLPLLVATGVLRFQLCRRYSVLPARRLVDLLRICGAAVGACLVTELGEWIAVALGLHRAAWDAATIWQVVALMASTVAMVGVGLLLRSATHAVDRVARPAAQPDWLADAVTLGLRASGVLRRQGDRGGAAVRWTDAHVVTRVRSHPVVAAVLLASVLALPYVATKIVLEGYPPALVLLSFALPAGALFALIVLVGRYLRIVAPRLDTSPAGVSAAVVACIVGTLVFALHDSLLPRHQTAAELNALLFGGAIAGGIASIAMRVALGRLSRY